MATFLLADRVKETSATTGTGTLTLDGAPSGFQTFLSALGSGNITSYSINDNAGNWENGIGTVGATTLTRTTILSSSNAGAAVNFSAPSLDVWCDVSGARLSPILLDREVAPGGAGVSSIDFTGIDDTYIWHEFRWYGLIPVTDSVALYGRISIAASFLAANYSGERGEFAAAAAASATMSAAAQLTLNSNVGNTAGEQSNGSLILPNPADTTIHKVMTWDSSHLTAGVTYTRASGMGKYTGANSAVDGFRLLFSSGNIRDGVAEHWAYRVA